MYRVFQRITALRHQSKRAELVFLPLPVSLPQFAALAVEALSRQAVATLATIQLGEDTPSVVGVINEGE